MVEDSLELGVNDQHVADIIEEHQQFSDLSEEQRQQLLEYVNAVRDIELARVEVEQAKGWRAVFENAPPKTIPFIIYSVYVACYAIVAVMYVSRAWEFVSLWLAMVLPLFVLPMSSYKKTFRWFKGAVSKR